MFEISNFRNGLHKSRGTLVLVGWVWLLASLSGCQPNAATELGEGRAEARLIAAPAGSTPSSDVGPGPGVADRLASPINNRDVIRPTKRTPMTAGGASSAESISTDGHEPRTSSGSSPSSSAGSRMEVRLADPGSATDPRSSPARKATPPASASDRQAVHADDPNPPKIEAFLKGWLSSEHDDEIETFLVRGREATTFKADRYYTWITTMDEHSYNLTVDVYHDGRIRVFKSEKLY